ncbi:MAG TPA: hypothetical protein VIV60_26620 [Polyangiaceae bacterium]
MPKRAALGVATWLLQFGLLLAPFGCAMDGATSNDSPSGSADGSGGSTEGTDVASGQSIVFEPPAVSIPVLGQGELTVRVAPPRNQVVTFSLVGNSLDASLETAKVATDALGVATVVLRAPSSTTTFNVRALVDRSTVAQAPVTIRTATTGTIDTSTKYNGSRKVAAYVVAVYPDADCTTANLNDKFPGRIVVKSTLQPIAVDSVPLGKPIAIIVEGDHVLRGCTAVRGVTDTAPVPVTVALENLPMNTDGVTLDLAMSTTDRLQALRDLLSSNLSDAVARLSPSGNDLVDLLVAMETESTGSLKQAFSLVRTNSDWDAHAVESYASVAGETLLRRQLEEWLKQGVELLTRQPSLNVRLSLGPRDSPTPRLGLLSLAGIDTSLNRLSPDRDLSVTTESDDRMNWSARLVFTTTAVYDVLALAAANQQRPGLADVPAQLANRFDCAAFANLLDQQANWGDSARACGPECLSALCERGISAMYHRVIELTYAVQAEIQLNASGQVQVDTNAVPVAMLGSWLGALSTSSNASSNATMSGDFVSQ